MNAGDAQSLSDISSILSNGFLSSTSPSSATSPNSSSSSSIDHDMYLQALREDSNLDDKLPRFASRLLNNKLKTTKAKDERAKARASKNKTTSPPNTNTNVNWSPVPAPPSYQKTTTAAAAANPIPAPKRSSTPNTTTTTNAIPPKRASTPNATKEIPPQPVPSKPPTPFISPLSFMHPNLHGIDVNVDKPTSPTVYEDPPAANKAVPIVPSTVYEAPPAIYKAPPIVPPAANKAPPALTTPGRMSDID